MAGLAGLLWCQGRPQGVRDGVLLVGVRLEACEIVEEAQRLGVESSGCDGDHRHEPVVASLKQLVVLGYPVTLQTGLIWLYDAGCDLDLRRQHLQNWKISQKWWVQEHKKSLTRRA